MCAKMSQFGPWTLDVFSIRFQLSKNQPRPKKNGAGKFHGRTSRCALWPLSLDIGFLAVAFQRRRARLAEAAFERRRSLQALPRRLSFIDTPD